MPTCLRASNYYVPTCLGLLRAYVPSCLRASNYYYVPTCLTLLLAYVPTCLKLLRALIFTCLRAYLPIYIFQAYVPLCHKLFRSYVRSFFTCLRGNISKYIEAHFYTLLLFLSGLYWPFIPLKTPKHTPVSKAAYHNPILWVLLFQLVHAQKA